MLIDPPKNDLWTRFTALPQLHRIGVAVAILATLPVLAGIGMAFGTMGWLFGWVMSALVGIGPVGVVASITLLVTFCAFLILSMRELCEPGTRSWLWSTFTLICPPLCTGAGIGA